MRGVPLMGKEYGDAIEGNESADRKYEELVFESRQATLAAVASGEPEIVTRAVLACSLESEDPAFIETLAVALSLSSDSDVRRSAVLALGHLARRFGRVNRPAVDSIMARIDGDAMLMGALHDLRDDLAVFASEDEISGLGRRGRHGVR